MTDELIKSGMFPTLPFKDKVKLAARQYCFGNREKVEYLLDEMLSRPLVNRKISMHEILSVFEEMYRNEEVWWFKKDRESLSTAKIKYMCVVVLLESVSYWCWYNHNYSSDFDEETLREVLKYPLLISEDFYLSEL